jgi:WD40 repeat protein
MKAQRFLLPSLLAFGLAVATGAQAQSAPQIVWSVPTPSGLSNSIVGVAWSPAGGRVAVGSTDRWARARTASNGALQWSTLQVPIGSGTADQMIFSNDSALVAVHNSGQGWTFRVHRAADGVFIGKLVGTLQPNNIATFAPDAQLASATGDATFNNWRLSSFATVKVIGSGYKKIATSFVFSPDGALQASATQGTITVQRRSDGATMLTLTGGNLRSTTPMAFSPDSATLAEYQTNPNETTLFRISDGAVLRHFPNQPSNEGVVAVRFSPGGTRLVTTGWRAFEGSDGLWDQVGTIRFWRVSDGALRHNFEAGTGIGVTSPVAWNPGFTRFAYGTYEGRAVVAVVPAP